MRTIILHYHLFKNAGTSLDAALKANFSEVEKEWVTNEFPGNPQQNREGLKQWIIDNPQAKCFSSHTAIFPVPHIEGINIIPALFLRNPIDRIASAYSFEKNEKGNGFGCTLARHTTLAGYVDTHLSINARQCINFQSQRLATMFDEKQGDEATRATMAIENLPFIGLVERYSQSLTELEQLLRNEGFEGVTLKPVEANVSRPIQASLDDKLAEIKAQLGEELYQRLLMVNELDLTLWRSQL